MRKDDSARRSAYKLACLSEFKKIPRWLYYGSVAGVVLFSIIVIAIVSNQAELLKVSHGAIPIGYLKDFFRTNLWCKICLGLMLACFVIGTGCCAWPFIMGRIAIRLKRSHEINEWDTPSEGGPMAASLTMEDRIDALKPLIVDYFWQARYWRLGTDYSKNFMIDLEELINKKQNMMALGHLAYILKENNWISNSNCDFKNWLYSFFDALGLDRPSETSPSKYSGKNISMAASFDEVDQQFSYLLDRKKHPVPNEKSW